MFRSMRSGVAALAVAGLMGGCATTAVPWGQSVEQDAVVFDFLSTSTTQEIKAPYGRVTPTNDSFVRVEVAMLNKTREPLTFGQLPVFRLADEAGTRYDVHSLQTMAVNRERANSGVAGTMNPNVRYARELVFEVPRGKQYVLEVTVPARGRSAYTAGGRSTRPDFSVALPLTSQRK